MKMFNDKVRIIPYEAETHWAYIYQWYHSGKYDHFFGNMPSMDANAASTFNKGGVNYIIIDVNDVSKIVGMASINMIEERHRNCHLGTLIDESYQGKKIGTEATIMIVNRILNYDNMFKVIARVDPKNLGSQKVTAAVGFEQESILKQDVYYDGEFHDVIRMKITKGMFNKKYKSRRKKDPVEGHK